MTTDSGDMNSKTNATDLTAGAPGDDELLAQLRDQQATIDPPPAGLAEVAMRALTWDTEFAELVAATPSDEPVLVRGAATAEIVDFVFEVNGTTLEVAAEPITDSGNYRLSGMVHPRRDHLLVVTPGAEQRRIDCDSFGRFEVDEVVEPFALAFELADGRVVRTELFDLP